MRNWIIKKLGGYTYCEVYELEGKYRTEISELKTKLTKALKNDHRDGRGKFIKADNCEREECKN